MSKNDLISIIVPCYNVEKYVEKAINSILGQSYENIEILAVDDCSSDKTYEILLELNKKYSNKIRVIKNKKNKGAAYSRNVALKQAKGKYIGFIDPDDYIDKDYYKNLYEKMIEDNADISITDIVLVDEKGNVLNGPIRCYNGEELNIENVLNCGLVASPCNKLFKKNVIEKFPFLEGKMNEDVASIIPALVNSKEKLTYVNGEKYYYVQRKNSAQNSDFSEKRFDMFEAIDICLDKISKEKNYQNYAQIILYHQVLMLYTCVIVEIEDSKKRAYIIKKFLKLQKKYKLYNNSLAKFYIASQRKIFRGFYFLLIKLLRFNSAKMINAIVNLKNFTYNTCRYLKRQIRRAFGKNVIKYNIKLKDVVKMAKKQKNMKDNDVKISVVIPNYNYAKFMYQRLYSILYQNVKIHEIILLDDCSNDNSKDVINKIYDKISKYINIKVIYNEKNSGSPFKQWKKGFLEATGDYVWIAEADDYCSNKMLEKLVEKINENKSIQIAYVDTAFIDEYGNIMLKTITPEIDIMKTGHWNDSFVDKGISEIEKYCFLNCIIANVSSCLIKNENYDDIFEKISVYKQAGDWLFYNLVMERGDLCYVNLPINYYRVHGSNVTSVTKKQKHFDEIKMIHDENRKLIDFTPWHEEEINKRYEFLKRVWELD